MSKRKERTHVQMMRSWMAKTDNYLERQKRGEPANKGKNSNRKHANKQPA